ncbi:MAG: trypsin-like peptidase domain-containing protein [Oscillospiraceae bacterium]|nr:trypsin-like peptidase domain-containing protein [Oscillospiraceae bacterium]MDD6086006.1 trypsin-like peptidase domain-containing protein [Oscillospiraceae bacterium]MDY3258152.1 trypsin-like peptidase domain-containing protein [Ruminococcus callidus]
MNKKNKNKDDKPDIYDVLKDNPRWAEEEKKAENKSQSPLQKVKIPSEIKEDEKNISDISQNPKSDSKVENFLFEDEKSELEEENKSEFNSVDFLNTKNKETEKKNQEQFQRELEARKDDKFTFYKSYSKKISAALWLLGIAVVALAVYCIASDMKTADVSGLDSVPATEITQSAIPSLDLSEKYVDENGKYTAEGVAQVVRPSIVDIYCYESESDKENKNVYGTGSGIIIKDNGYIVTNAHVLENASVFYVVTDNNEEFAAELKGRDSKTDLAVLKIDAVNLKAAQIGDSDKVVVGEEVIAIGNPAGLSGTVTNGIVSALNRQIKLDETGFVMQCIQTNAAISPGNSGGALVNMYGQVIGITSSKYANSNYEGLGFAITINQALPVINQLLTNGYVEGRVKMGIKFNSLNDSNTKTAFYSEFGFELPKNFKGLWITEISDDCDIASTELKVNDFITSIEGVEVSDYSELHEVISGYSAGDTLSADCVRFDKEGNKETFKIKFKLSADTSGDY